MFELEPGPIDLGALPLGPRVAVDGLLETFAADYVAARRNADVPLGLAQTTLLEGGAPDNAGAYTRIVGPAEDVTAAELAAGAESQLVEFSADGDAVDQVALGGR